MNGLEWRNNALECASGLISPEKFADWICENTWECEQSEIYAIKILLAEFSNGDWTESELRQMLRSLACRYEMGQPLWLSDGSLSSTSIYTLEVDA